MTRDGGKSGRTGRHVTPEEAELWEGLKHSLQKVKGKPRVPAHAMTPAAPPAARAPSRPEKAQPRPSPKASAPAPKAPPVAPLADFDRRAFRQVASGKFTIDDRIDLHGLGRQEARTRLRAFLLGSQAKGHKVVLVITGKGGEAEGADHLARMLGGPERGVLRRSVPQWLEEHEFRTIVLSYTAAGVRHGGEGALYVRLRKAR
jgi:DNA-nicking Smr family endonuclease